MTRGVISSLIHFYYNKHAAQMGGEAVEQMEPGSGEPAVA